ncbi:hypothetical protein DY000_02055233 [Brassica cretica]|uniref:Ubiquitin-like protease family profile domain-containing protein n=1 Tax=Brassica cretica TaxID=69181 RepID=A0ABQ7AJZ6_BRACR|nr:hypothetical protein DY000_02055233 [Brassica cretica]
MRGPQTCLKLVSLALKPESDCHKENQSKSLLIHNHPRENPMQHQHGHRPAELKWRMVFGVALGEPHWVLMLINVESSAILVHR